MIQLSINPELKDRLPQLRLGCVSAAVAVRKHDTDLWREINDLVSRRGSSFKPDAVNSIPQIAAMRNAYKSLGKDPSRYRGSAEALLRRVLAGKGVYQINNVVDVNNLVSLESLLPAGSYDVGNVTPPLELRIGRAGETYKGIGKDEINIENLPVFADVQGPFGSPTSDSERAMIRLETTTLLMVIFSFNGREELERWTARAGDLLRQYAGATQLQTLLL